MKTPAVGDWIRFMYHGQLVVDVITYIVPRASWNSTPDAMTLAHGRVRFDDILELRRERAALEGK